MKTTTIFALALLLTGLSFAQQGINYKALVNDNGGNVVANQNITIQFQILKGAGMVNVYQETHNPVTDVNGIVIVNIGTGTTSDDFTAIDWGSDDHFLNVQIDTGSGLTDMGTTQFMSVPYALQATKASNVTGLEALDEGSGNGWRLIGRDPTSYGSLGLDAKDFSYSNATSSVFGATGDYSTATGAFTEASGAYSLATGNSTKASAQMSTAMGANTVASGHISTALGWNTTASGFYASTLGVITKAQSYASVALGTYNLGGGTPDSWVATDPLFEIGIGTGDVNRANALTVLKNGTITAPDFSVGEIDTAGNPALITKEYADTNYNPTGLEAIDEGNGIGWRLIGRDPANYGNLGLNAVDLSYSNVTSSILGATGNNSTAMGQFTEASGSTSIATGHSSIASGVYSTAMGISSTASGYSSTAMGKFTLASGLYSTSMGQNTIASLDNATAMGAGTVASGFTSTTMGFSTKAESHSSLAIGRYNLGGGTAGSWVGTDPLFEIGNGSSDLNRANALTVLKNGTITAPDFSVAEIDAAGNPALITKEYFDANMVSASKINDLADGKSDDDGSNNGSSVYLGLNAGLNDDSSDNKNVGVGFEALTSNTTGSSNAAMGYQALHANSSGNFNTGIGNQVLYSNTTGTQNTASGFGALYSNTTGNYSTAYGFSALYANTTGTSNTAIGYLTLFSNGTGINNTANGYRSMFSNTDGFHNTAIGYKSLEANTTGINNTANGFQALLNNSTGNYNTAVGSAVLMANNGNNNTGIGYNTLYQNTGNNNTSVGRDALSNNTTGSNNIGIGYSANVPNGTADNQVQIGNGNITSLYCTGAYMGTVGGTNRDVFVDSNGKIGYVASSARYKNNIAPMENTDWLFGLRPVNFTYKNDELNLKQYGLIAEEVEKINPSLVSYNNDGEVETVGYSKLIAPMLKVIQEQQKHIDNLENENKALKSKYSTLDQRLKSLETSMNR